MTKKVHFYVVCIICIAMFSSCYPDDFYIKQEEPVKPCASDVDSTIKFDTLWAKDINSANLIFNEKYLVSQDNERNVHLYAASTGELLTTLDPSIFNYMHAVSIMNDYVIIKKNDHQDRRMHVYSILENKYSAFHLPHDYFYPKSYYTTDGTHLIIAVDKVICSMDFSGNIIDTLYDIRHLPRVDRIDNLNMYIPPTVLNRKYLIFSYNEIDENDHKKSVSNLIIYDLVSKRLIKRFPSDYLYTDPVLFMRISDHTLQYMDNQKILIYDFKREDHYIRSQSFLTVHASPPVHIIPGNYDQNGTYEPILFYNSSGLTAYDLKSTNIKWNCEYSSAKELSTVRLLRQNGDLETYLLALNYSVDLIDPDTGVVKATFSKKHAKNSSGILNFMSQPQSDNTFFTSDTWKLYKLQIRVN